MKVLITEDEPEIYKPYKIVLENRGHDVTITTDGRSCLEEYQNKLLSQNKNNKNKVKKSNKPPFDVVVLDYRIPEIDGLEVAKRILNKCPKQRIIFASAYVKQTLEESVKTLKQVVELLQKPFEPDILADTIEDQEVYDGLKSLIVHIRDFNLDNPSHNQMKFLFEGLRKIQKNRTF